MVNSQDNTNDFLLELLQQKTTQLEKTGDVRQILLRFLTVLDSLLRLVNQADTTDGDKLAAWIGQVRIINEQVIEIFEGYGLSFMDTVGQPFDPNMHEAVGTESAPGIPDQTVLREIRRGCWWNGTVLRTAQVIIVKNV
jgi:molecular chaperone GrpE